MPKPTRHVLAALAIVAGAVTFFAGGVAHAGIGAGAAPTFPATVTVGDTGLPASIEMQNDNSAPNEGDTNTVCNFGDDAPCPGVETGITLTPACGALGSFSICDPSGFDPGVFAVSSTGLGATGTACAAMVFDISVMNASSGQLRFTPQGGAHVLLPAAGAICRVNFTFDVLKMPTVDYQPANPGIQTVAVTDNTQHNSDPNGSPASGRGTTFPAVTVQRAQPTIATTASADTPLGGTALTDVATVSGRVNPQPGATIDFRLYGPNDLSCTGTPVFESLGVPYPVSGGPVTSAPFTPTAPGTYRWIASYSGDVNNAPVSGACNDANENTVVTKAQPTITTTASPQLTVGSPGAFTDTAVVEGRVSPQPGATIDFRLYGPNDADCSGTPLFESLAVPYPVAGGPVTSQPFTPTVPGTYRWIASYSGDVNNAAVSGACNDTGETTSLRAQPTILTAASAAVNLGDGTLTDTATVSGRVDPQPGATIDFRLYGPDDADCSGTPVFESLGVPYPVAGGPVTSQPFTPNGVGTYRWIATYSGDPNNAPVAGECNDTNENVEVRTATPAIATTASPSVEAKVGQLTDSAVVTGRVNPQAGATIDFRLYGPGDPTCSGTPVFESLGIPYPVSGGAVTSGAYTPPMSGQYRWIATYSGDANNRSVTGTCGDPSETVNVTPPQSGGPELPATGPGETGWMMWMALGFILLGVLLLAPGSRREDTTVHRL